MRKVWYLFVLGLLCSCQLQDLKPIHQSPTQTDEVSVADPSIAAGSGRTVTNCDSDLSAINLSADLCNTIAWQNYLAEIPTLSEEQRTQRLEMLTISSPDELKRLLLNTAPALPLQQRIDNQILLFDKASTLPNPLGNLIFMYASQNQRLIEQEIKTSQLETQNLQQQKQLKQLQSKLAQTQKKIDALTEIEQQLNDVESNTQEGTESE
ncbi:hypothetical protein [Gynuella sunshinyii]|uniref:Uncharacterized protein n=1 Tax=Gynuella sunshinyii YC6258 TaxID=1445510 RepID=A0A0C5VH08_9GAMM|nr:hypothetical protein [Gynuella sunshinyii]AJQ93516.1 hypothetical Protein YC6258_01468 [Gynuella sunshinyii YC6258]